MSPCPQISLLMMTQRTTVAAIGEGAAAEVADCASEFARGFDSEAGSGADFVSSDLRHMGTSQTPKPCRAGCAGQSGAQGSTREIRCKEGIECHDVGGERKKRVPLLRTRSECRVRSFIRLLRWYDFAP